MIDAKIQQLTCLNNITLRVKDHLNLKPELKPFQYCSIILAQFLSKKQKNLSHNKLRYFSFFDSTFGQGAIPKRRRNILGGRGVLNFNVARYWKVGGKANQV